MTASIPVELTDMGENMRKSKRWSDADIHFLKENVNQMTNKQMGDQLGVSPPAVSVKLSAFKIKRDKKSDRAYTKDLSTQVELPANPKKKDFFILDFSQHGDLYDRLLSFADDNFRTADNQALYFIHQALQADGN